MRLTLIQILVTTVAIIFGVTSKLQLIDSRAKLEAKTEQVEQLQKDLNNQTEINSFISRMVDLCSTLHEINNDNIRVMQLNMDDLAKKCNVKLKAKTEIISD